MIRILECIDFCFLFHDLIIPEGLTAECDNDWMDDGNISISMKRQGWSPFGAE